MSLLGCSLTTGLLISWWPLVERGKLCPRLTHPGQMVGNHLAHYSQGSLEAWHVDVGGMEEWLGVVDLTT